MGNLTFGAIETAYKGCRFRSRLEARWAVFFDALGIEWQYEPEGFEVVYGPDSADVHRYLPDFYLPKSKTYVEIKGTQEAFKHDVARTISVATSGALKGCDLLLLGPIPESARLILHPTVHAVSTGTAAMHYTFFKKGGLQTTPSLPLAFVVDLLEVSIPGSPWEDAPIAGIRFHTPRYFPHVGEAYTAARSARFEHGENGGAVCRHVTGHEFFVRSRI
jgi:hypothetical protein